MIDIFSFISLFCYSITYFPQLKLILYNKSVEGLSVIMICMWTQADFLALLATLLLALPWNLVLIDMYHISISLVTIVCILLYSEEDRHQYTWYIVLFVITNICILLSAIETTHIFLGEIIAWMTSILYIGGRIPQIIKNKKRKSVEGLSRWMYILTMIANVSYLCSLFVSDLDRSLWIYLPWIILIGITFFLDAIVLYQFYLYLPKNNDLPF